MSVTIQTGVTPTFDSISAGGKALALAYSDAQTLLIKCEDQAAYMAYSEPALQSRFTRIKLEPSGIGESPYALTIPLPVKAQSGVLYFCSADNTVTGFVTLTAFDCGSANY